MAIERWMSWEGGFDLVAATDAGLSQPNLIVHVARMVHTPVGSASSGMVLWQPDPAGPPQFAGFVSTDAAVGAYFGPNIFAGTPFEQAPAHQATIAITPSMPGSVSARVEVGDLLIEAEMSGLGELEATQRPAGAMPPFAQMVLEAAASSVSVKINGQPVQVTIPPTGITGGPAAVWSPAGIYTR